MSKENGICGDPLGTKLDPEAICARRKGHRGLHVDEFERLHWAGNQEIPVFKPFDPSHIQRSQRNGALVVDIGGTTLRLPRIDYKSGFDFFWWESKDAIGLLGETVTRLDGRLTRVGNQQVYPKAVVKAVAFDMVRPIIQDFIRSLEYKIMESAAYIDDEPLWKDRDER
jgi:hypothetical protein